MTTFDAALWSAAIALGAFATWLALPRPPTWDPRRLFALALGPTVPLADGADPATAGPEDDPRRRLGPGCDADAVARWATPVEAALRRRFAGERLVWFEAPALTVPELPVSVLGSPAAAEPALEGLLADRGTRLVLAARHEAGGLLRLLHGAPGLRDRVRAVLLVDADLSADQDWIAAHFTHAGFDLEQARVVPFLTLRVQGRTGQVLRPPPAVDRGFPSVSVVDLGAVPAEAVGEPAVARAVAVVLAAVVG